MRLSAVLSSVCVCCLFPFSFGCDDSAPPPGTFEPMAPPPGAKLPPKADPAPKPVEPAPAEPVQVEPPDAPPPMGSVQLRWKLPKGKKLAYKFFWDPIPAKTDPAHTVSVAKLIEASALPKALSARLAGMAPNMNTKLTALLTPSYGSELEVRVISDDFEMPDMPDPALVKQVLASGAGTELSGTLSGRGKPISSGDSDHYRLLSLMFELPEKHVLPGDTWTLDVDLLPAGKSLERKEKKQVSRASLKALKMLPGGKHLAVIEYLVGRSEKCEDSSSEKAKPYVRSVIYVARGEFLVEEGRWNKYVGRMQLNDPVAKEGKRKIRRGFSLAHLQAIPVRYQNLK